MKEYVAASCPKCSKGVSARREYIGRDVSCKHCGNIFTVLAAVEEAPGLTWGLTIPARRPGSVDSNGLKQDNPELIRFECPRCSKRLKMRREMLGNKVTCRRCEHVFETHPAVDSVAPTGEFPSRAAEPVLVCNLQDASNQGMEKGPADEPSKLRALLDQLREDWKQERKAHEDEVTRLREELVAATRDAEARTTARLSDQATTARRKYEAKIGKVRTQLETASQNAKAESLRLRAEQESARAAWEIERRQIEDDGQTRQRSVLDECETLRAVVEELRSQLEQTEDRLEAERLRQQDERSRVESERDSAIAESDRLRELGEAEADRIGIAAALERLRETHQEEAESHRVEIERVRDERDRIADQAADLDRTAQGLNRDLQTVRDVLATAQGEREAERAEWGQERERATASARESGEQFHRTVADLNARLREAEDQINVYSASGRRDGAVHTALEADLAEKTAEIEDLRQAVRDAQTYKKEMATFLSGLGIRLPG